jgi:hypothetical protein
MLPASAETTAQINYSLAPTTVTASSKVKSTEISSRNTEIVVRSAFGISENEKLLVQGTLSNLDTPAYDARASVSLPKSPVFIGVAYAHLNGLGGLGYGLTAAPMIGKIMFVGSSFLYPNVGGQFRLIKNNASVVVGATGTSSFVLGFKQDRSVPLKGIATTFDTYGPYAGLQVRL